jgi:hypothetical protein
LCIASRVRFVQRPREFVEVEVIGVELGRIDPGMAKKWSQSSDVVATLSQEAVREAMT